MIYSRAHRNLFVLKYVPLAGVLLLLLSDFLDLYVIFYCLLLLLASVKDDFHYDVLLYTFIFIFTTTTPDY